MKTLLKPILFIASLIIIALPLACSEDNNGDDDGNSNGIIEKITIGKWFLEDESQKVKTSKCEKQTSYEFKNDKTLEVNVYYEDGLGVCQFGNTSNHKFEINSDTDELTTTQIPEGTPKTYTVKKLTSDELILESETQTSSGTIYVNTITFDRTSG